MKYKIHNMDFLKKFTKLVKTLGKASEKKKTSTISIKKRYHYKSYKY